MLAAAIRASLIEADQSQASSSAQGNTQPSTGSRAWSGSAQEQSTRSQPDSSAQAKKHHRPGARGMASSSSSNSAATQQVLPNSTSAVVDAAHQQSRHSSPSDEVSHVHGQNGFTLTAAYSKQTQQAQHAQQAQQDGLTAALQDLDLQPHQRSGQGKSQQGPRKQQLHHSHSHPAQLNGQGSSSSKQHSGQLLSSPSSSSVSSLRQQPAASPAETSASNGVQASHVGSPQHASLFQHTGQQQQQQEEEESGMSPRQRMHSARSAIQRLSSLQRLGDCSACLADALGLTLVSWLRKGKERNQETMTGEGCVCVSGLNSRHVFNAPDCTQKTNQKQGRGRDERGVWGLSV